MGGESGELTRVRRCGIGARTGKSETEGLE